MGCNFSANSDNSFAISCLTAPLVKRLLKHRPASVHNRQIRAAWVTIERDAQRDTPFGTHTERSWRPAPRPSGHSALLFSILSLVRFSIASPRSPLPQSAAIETVIRIVGIDDLLDG